jgi:Fe2+ transport system protein FeoA
MAMVVTERVLADIPVGKRVKLVSIRGGRRLVRRLMALGLGVGNEFEVLHHRGRAVVVGNDGNRVALGAGVAEKIIIEELD